ncbi:MAG: alpha/beta hydrolase [Anaerolineae bacterium]|jgi:dienelactone hydrolase|nr:MAG: alpha/beta hydrolase [Anaerolineae bacterium]
MPKWLKLLLLGLLGVLLLGGSAFVLWASNPLPAMPEALAALQPDQNVEVRAEANSIHFIPRSDFPETGLIFYPGGRVDPRAYAPLAHEIAAHGFLAVIVKMPLNLAFFNPNAAQAVMTTYPQMQHWVVGGHSLGGAMATKFAKQNLSQVAGLILLASYPANSDDLSATDLAVLSIYATQDGLATVEKIRASQALLPENTQWVVIEGGNHAQFGWYGEQPGDGRASLSRQEQQRQTLATIINFLESVQRR